MKRLLASPGVLVGLMAMRGSTSVRVLPVEATEPLGGLSGPARAAAEKEERTMASVRRA